MMRLHRHAMKVIAARCFLFSKVLYKRIPDSISVCYFWDERRQIGLIGFPFFSWALPWGLQSEQSCWRFCEGILWVSWITAKQNHGMSLRTFKSFESVAWIRFKIGADKCPLITRINGLRGMQNENTF